jgi:hypothetical protein
MHLVLVRSRVAEIVWIASLVGWIGCTPVDCPSGTSKTGGSCMSPSPEEMTPDGSIDGSTEAGAAGAPSKSPEIPTGAAGSSPMLPAPAADGGSSDAGMNNPAPSNLPCEAGALRCDSGNTRVEVCGVDGSWQPREQCSSSCAQGVCMGVCTPNIKRCAPNQRQEVCDPAGMWTAVQVCPYACEQGECTGECRPSEKRCSGDKGLTPQTCDEHGKWIDGSDCPNLCSNGSCAGSCTPAATKCGLDQIPSQCSEDGTWEPQQACPYVCSGQGKCTGMCKPGDKRCGGADMLIPEVCNDSGSWISGNACPNICSSGSCGGTCSPGARRCNVSGIPELCSDMGTWEPQAACPFVCSGEGMCTGECTPGARSCSGTTPRSCDRTGTWRAEAACAYVCTGDGRCSGECKPATKGCVDQTPRSCDDSGTWRSGTVCAGSACNATTGSCMGSCMPNTAHCAADQTRETCNNSGVWVRDRVCPNVCTGAGECTGTCKPGSKTCSGVVARTCAADGSAYTDLTCAPRNEGETATCSAGACGSSCDANPGRCPGSSKCWSLQYGCDECIEPYVWRQITSSDHVCVTGDARSLVQSENAAGPSHVTTDPNLIAMYGADACAAGYVWRDAYSGDHVCVTSDARTRSANENSAHAGNTRVGRNP